MKDKHLKIRIEQCLLLATASNCPRRKFGALLVDPARNVVLMDAYNGGPRGADGPLCGGYFCERDGLKAEELQVIGEDTTWGVKHVPSGMPLWMPEGRFCDSQAEAEGIRQQFLIKYPGVKSGTHMEVGCHHSESNVICNAAAAGVRTQGGMLIVTGEPCMMCAKLIHHAGIAEVILVKGGYAGGRQGVEYLTRNGVECTEVDGPEDPRATRAPGVSP